MTDTVISFVLGGIVTLALVCILRRLVSFQAQEGQDYAHLAPGLDLSLHLSGKLRCQGMIFGPFGRVTSRFVATMQMEWDGQTGSMTERFTYDDGTTMDRAWIIRCHEDGRIETEAEDVIGTGRGRQVGNALGLRYRIQLPSEHGGHVLDATDWLYLQEDGTLLNRSQFRKYGIKVAELFATIQPMEDHDDA